MTPDAPGMTPARTRRAAEVLRREAAIIRSSNRMLNGRWSPDAKDEKSQHDEMIALAEELEAMAAKLWGAR